MQNNDALLNPEKSAGESGTALVSVRYTRVKIAMLLMHVKLLTASSTEHEQLHHVTSIDHKPWHVCHVSIECRPMK